LEHVEDEREIDISEIVEILPLDLVGHLHIIVIQVTVVPCFVSTSSCSVEEKIPKVGNGLLSNSCEFPVVEDVHEEIVVIKARCCIVVTLHIVSRPESIQVVKVDGITPVLILVNIASKLLNDWACWV